MPLRSLKDLSFYLMLVKRSFVEKVIVNIMVEDQPRWLNFQKGNIDYLTIPKDNFDAVVTLKRS